MSAFDDRMVARAAAILDQRGKRVTITRATGATYDKATRTSVMTTAVTTPKVLMDKAVIRRKFGQGSEWQSGTQTQRDAKGFWLAGSHAELPEGATVAIDGKLFMVANCIPDYCGERVVLWAVTVVKG